MSQRTSVENLTEVASQASALNPKLQAVLGNLDVLLDDELARYRRKKRVEAQDLQSSSHRSHRPGTKKNLELVVTPLPLEVPSAEAEETLKGDAIEKETTEEQMDPEASATAESTLSTLSPQAATLSSTKPSSLVQSDDLKEQPHDYLESSEQLLGSLDEPKVNNLPTQSRSRRSRRRRSLKRMLSPLTVGVTLLFVLMLGSVAYILMGKVSDRQPVTTAGNTDPSQTETPLPEVPRSPNLADKEFVPLDLDTLGTLSSNNPTPTPTPTPTVPSSSSPNPIENSATTSVNGNQNYPSLENINTAILPKSVQDDRQNEATPSNNADPNQSDSANNSTAPAQNQPTVSAESFPAFHYVLIDYNNDDSLFIARQVVPDAYLREFPVGLKIQMAALEDAAAAQQMVKYLQEQGLAAQVYKP